MYNILYEECDMNECYKLQKFDRVILTMDWKYGDNIISGGTIGTYRATINDNSLVQIADCSIWVGLPEMLLRQVTQEELQTVKNPESLIPRMYHIGNTWTVQTGYMNNQPIYIIGKIIEIKLAVNEEFDKIKILMEDNTEKEYEKRFLENYGSYLSMNIPKY